MGKEAEEKRKAEEAERQRKAKEAEEKRKAEEAERQRKEVEAEENTASLEKDHAELASFLKSIKLGKLLVKLVDGAITDLEELLEVEGPQELVDDFGFSKAQARKVYK